METEKDKNSQRLEKYLFSFFTLPKTSDIVFHRMLPDSIVL